MAERVDVVDERYDALEKEVKAADEPVDVLQQNECKHLGEVDELNGYPVDQRVYAANALT